MSDSQVLTEALMLSRLAQSEQLREFFLQMWLQNPLLAERAGKITQDLLAPISLQAHQPTDLSFNVNQIR
jgi:hypothetical protein